MKFLRIDLLTLLISLFILSSCKNPDNVGLAIDPTKALLSNLIDTTTISAVTVKDDSISTNNLLYVPLAYFKDPVFGVTEANIAASLSLPGSVAFTSPLTTGTVTIDSAILVLPYAKGFYGDSLNTKYQINVYQLGSSLISSTTYYNFNDFSSGSTTLLGTQSFSARPGTNVSIIDIVTGKPDTIKKVAPQIRIKLTNTGFFYNSFFNANTSQLATNQVFVNAIKGLYITLDKKLTTGGPGGNIFLDFSGASSGAGSRVDIYSRNVTTGGSTTDTVVTSLPLGSTGAGSTHAAQIKHTFTASILNHINNKLTDSIYIKALSGLRAKIAFPFLSQKRLLHNLRVQSLKDNPSIDTLSITDIAINRAELVVTPVAATVVPYPPLPRLTLYRWDIANQKVLVPDASAADPRYLYSLAPYGFGGFFDTYHNAYKFVITGYIDDLMRSKLTNYGTFLAAADTVRGSSGLPTINTSNYPQVGGRSVIGGGNKTSPYAMKLNLLYNKVTK